MTMGGSDRWQRHDWWGVVLDAPDVRELAEFYSQLRGWRIYSIDEDGAALDLGEGRRLSRNSAQ